MRIVTAGVWLLVPVLCGVGIAIARSGTSAAGAVLVAAGIGDGILCGVYRGLQPVAYELDGAGLAIERRGRSPQHFSGTVTSMLAARLGLRVAGSGGLYGYLGRFRLVGGGRVSAFVTDRSATLVVRVGDSVLAVSPADRAAFLNDPAVSHA